MTTLQTALDTMEYFPMPNIKHNKKEINIMTFKKYNTDTDEPKGQKYFKESFHTGNVLPKIRVMVLISGRGSNFKALIDAKLKEVQIVSCVTTNQDAKGLYYALGSYIPIDVINLNDPEGVELINCVDKYRPDIIILAGFMEIIAQETLDRLARRKIAIINIHPSLLPEYKGLNTHQRVLDAGDEWHGCTTHYVTPEVDGGNIIAQARMRVLPGTIKEGLEMRVLELEHKLLSATVKLLAREMLGLSIPHISFSSYDVKKGIYVI